MKYEINGFDDVFENQNFIQLREVRRFLRKAELESWVGLGGGKLSIQLNFAYHYYVSGAFASVSTERFVMKVEVNYSWILLCIWPFLSFFFLHYLQCLKCSRSLCKLRQLASYIFLDRYYLVSKNISFWDKSKVWYECCLVHYGCSCGIGFQGLCRKGCQLKKVFLPT